MNFPPQKVGRYLVDVSTRAYERYPNGTLVTKEEHYGFYKTRSIAKCLAFLADEGEFLWLGVEQGVGGQILDDPCLLVYRIINSGVHVTPLAFREWGSSTTDFGWIFPISATRTLTLHCLPDNQHLRMCFTDIFDSRVDARTRIKAIWDIEAHLVSPGEVPPENFAPISTDVPVLVHPPPAAYDKNGKRLQHCSKCKRPRRGHFGRLGAKCTFNVL